MQSKFKTGFDTPKRRSASPAIQNSGAGMCLAYDERNKDPFPIQYLLASATILQGYSKVTDEWLSAISPALTGVFGAGALALFKPTAGPTGVIASGATVNKVTLSTALPSAVAINQMIDRGDGLGFRVKIIDSLAGGTGKTWERRIVANTAGTTPTIVFDAPLDAVPGVGATYEFITPRIYLISAGLLAAGSFKYYDVLTNSLSGNLSITNLPATITTDSCGVVLDERYVPYNRKSGEGFLVGATATYDSGIYAKACLVATATGGSMITGMVSEGDFVVKADEYKNFQIRIVEDTTNKTAVGQRRKISTHTAGPSAIYTLSSAWTVTPSATAKFVIENDNDTMHVWSTANTATYTYTFSANTWSNVTIPARSGAIGAGCFAEQAFSIDPDADRNARHSHIYCGRGANGNVIDVLDIATATRSNDIVYGNKGLTLFTTGTSSAKDSATNEGRYVYINANGTQRGLRFDMKGRTLEPNTFLRTVVGAAVAGGKMSSTSYTDPTDNKKISSIFNLVSTSNLFYRLDCVADLTPNGE